MSLQSRAASSLVASLNNSKESLRAKGVKSSRDDVFADDDGDARDEHQPGAMSAPPRPPLSSKDQENEDVLKLNIPQYDKKRPFPGLARMKVEKKERHNRALDDFGKLLDRISEELEQNVLQLSLEMRETLEGVDAEFQAYYRTLEDDQFLVVRSEADLVTILGESREKVAHRSGVVESFATDLVALEVKRADVAGAELKKLVDKLIGIAHQLPDEIEHIVENETFDLNKVLTANRESHAQLLVMLRKAQVQVEAETVQRWEDARRKWRQLRHDKGIHDFLAHIFSAEFTDPDDRQHFLARTRHGQGQRYDQRCEQLGMLASLTSDNIQSKAVEVVKDRFSSISEAEMFAMQDTYNGLSSLRTRLRVTAEERVEALRKELHVYGYLEPEPDLLGLADALQGAINDPSLSELWRLGGGLKTEFLSLVAELTGEDVVYDRVMLSVQERLEMIVSSFGLKGILEERGRLPQLERIRNMIVKLRNVARAESPAVVKGIMPLLEEILDVEAVPALFKKTAHDCLSEMVAELAKIDAAKERAKNAPKPPLGTSSGASIDTASTSQSGKSAAPRKTAGKGTAGNRTTRGSIFGSGTAKSRGGAMAEEENSDLYIDPIILKIWNRKLGILYFGSDLPQDVQLSCIQGIDQSIQKMACNKAVDTVVMKQSDKIMNRMDRRYKKLIDSIANFLEAQENFYVTCAHNVTDFFMRLARMVEEHRALQAALDERSADDMWDLSEDFRLEREEREEQFEAACQRLRASADSDTLQENFAAVLSILADIEESYRVYHSKACFAADRYPLYLIDEFKRYTTTVAAMFDMKPFYKHPMLKSYDEIYDETVRLNKKFFEADPAAGGVALREDRDSASPAEKRLAEAARAAQEADAAAAAAGGNKKASVAVSKKMSTAVAGSASSDGSVTGEDPEPHLYDSPNLVAIEEYRAYVEEQEAIERLSGGTGAKRDKGALTDVFGRPIPQDPVPEEPTIPSMAGMFAVENALADVAARFTVSAADAEESEAAAAAAAAALAAEDGAVASAPGTAAPAKPSTATSRGAVREPHPSFPWLARETSVLPLSREDMEALGAAEDPEDLQDYKDALHRFFLPLGDDAVVEMEAAADEEAKEAEAAAAAAAKAAKGKPADPPPAEAHEDEPPMRARLNAFRICEEVYKEVQAHIDAESNPAIALENVPTCEANGEPWVLRLEMSRETMERLVAGIRDSLVVAQEREAFRRIDNAKALATLRKGELTEELEGRLRTHWPRRGRVETQIKQPREAELLSHEEKTWRHIRAIQTRMTDIQRKFFAEMASSESCRQQYIEDVVALKTSLTSQTFRNLASLQVYDVNARRKTLDFQSACASQLASLTRICDDEVASAVAFANDFRKVCPAQVPGVEGGYSEAELAEIDALVRGQCEEIAQVVEEWRAQLVLLGERQVESLKNQDVFSAVYENVALDLAMSEGLGQKYGAPRRRAGEKIRTAVTRDEQAAGKVDELLAQLEFICAEEQRREDAAASSGAAGLLGGADAMSVASDVAGGYVVSNEERTATGQAQLAEVNRTWDLLKRARKALRQRVAFLKVEDTPVAHTDLAWLSLDRFVQRIPWESGTDDGDEPAADAAGASDPESSSSSSSSAAFAAADAPEPPTTTLFELVSETDAACRDETKDMYRVEGKSALLEGTTAGVPESLQTWLTEVKEKILGPRGHREKAWKRLWGQVGRLESIFTRKHVEDDGDPDAEPDGSPQPQEAAVVASPTHHHADVPPTAEGVLAALRVGAPAVCLRLMAEALQALVKVDRDGREARFAQRVQAWELVKEKHERFLRPVLGSPDKADDLAALDRVEKDRSTELSTNVIKFRRMLLSRLMHHARNFLEDVAVTSRNLILLLDSTVYRELLLVPPDTKVPKKRMTLKRMRKAQRLREEVASGQEARSQQRAWPALELGPIATAAASAEAAIAKDVARDADAAAAAAAAAANAPADAAVAAKDKKKSAAAAPPPAAAGAGAGVPETPGGVERLLPDKWLADLQAASAVRGGVSTAHRNLIAERDAAVHRYGVQLAIAVEEVASHCNTLLLQEESWIQRWNRQVAMLRQGQL